MDQWPGVSEWSTEHQEQIGKQALIPTVESAIAGKIWIQSVLSWIFYRIVTESSKRLSVHWWDLLLRLLVDLSLDFTGTNV